MWFLFFLFIAGIILGWLLGKHWKWSIILLLAPVYWAVAIFIRVPNEKGSCPEWAPCLDIIKSDVTILLFPIMLVISAAGIGVTYLLSRNRAKLQNEFNSELNKNPEASEYLISKMTAEKEEARRNATDYGKSLIDEKSKNK